MEKKLTIKEAEEQGFTKFGYAKESWQSVMTINTDAEMMLKGFPNQEFVIFIDGKYSPSIDGETIRDLIAEHVAINHADETGDDTNTVADSVMELDFDRVADMVNEKLKQHTFYNATDIKLILHPVNPSR